MTDMLKGISLVQNRLFLMHDPDDTLIPPHRSDSDAIPASHSLIRILLILIGLAAIGFTIQWLE